MNHAEAVTTNSALEPTTCRGELVDGVSLPDRHYVDGQMVERSVEVYRCQACGYHVSLTGHVALNHYHVPEPRAMVAALAAQVNTRSDRT